LLQEVTAGAAGGNHGNRGSALKTNESRDDETKRPGQVLDAGEQAGSCSGRAGRGPRDQAGPGGGGGGSCRPGMDRQEWTPSTAKGARSRGVHGRARAGAFVCTWKRADRGRPPPPGPRAPAGTAALGCCSRASSAPATLWFGRGLQGARRSTENREKGVVGSRGETGVASSKPAPCRAFDQSGRENPVRGGFQRGSTPRKATPRDWLCAGSGRPCSTGEGGREPLVIRHHRPAHRPARGHFPGEACATAK